MNFFYERADPPGAEGGGVKFTLCLFREQISLMYDSDGDAYITPCFHAPKNNITYKRAIG